jgi:hypothetical protein
MYTALVVQYYKKIPFNKNLARSELTKYLDTKFKKLAYILRLYICQYLKVSHYFVTI